MVKVAFRYVKRRDGTNDEGIDESIGIATVALAMLFPKDDDQDFVAVKGACLKFFMAHCITVDTNLASSYS